MLILSLKTNLPHSNIASCIHLCLTWLFYVHLCKSHNFAHVCTSIYMIHQLLPNLTLLHTCSIEILILLFNRHSHNLISLSPLESYSSLLIILMNTRSNKSQLFMRNQHIPIAKHYLIYQVLTSQL